MAQKITTEDLKQKLEQGARFYLVDALGPNSFAKAHIPGAINVPWDPNFMNNFRQRVGEDKNAEIVVYCSSETCQNSVMASKVLESHGFINIYHYAGGLAAWEKSGLEFAHA